MAVGRHDLDTSRRRGCLTLPARAVWRCASSKRGVNDPIPPKIKRFIDANISSVEQLELLLLLRRTKTRAWTAESASLELRTSPQSIATRISELAAQSLVRIEGAEFQYSASSSADGTIGELERVYATYRTRVITMIFDKPPRQIRDLADAFRLRRND
jgi:hypothetical protein